MTLKRKLDKAAFDALPETLKPLYVAEESGGGYRLDAEPDDGGELKKVVEDERNARRKVNEELATLKRRFEGIDPDEVAQLRINHDKLKAGQKPTKLDADELEAAIEARLKPIAEKHATELKTRDDKIASSQTRIETYMKRQIAAEALSDAGIKPEQHKVFIPHLLPSIKLIEKGENDYDHVIVEGDRERISKQQGNDGPMKAKEFVGFVLKEDPAFQPLYPSAAGSGSGAAAGAGRSSAGGAAAGGTPTKRISDMTVGEKVARMKAIGRDQWEAEVATESEATQRANASGA